MCVCVYVQKHILKLYGFGNIFFLQICYITTIVGVLSVHCLLDVPYYSSLIIGAYAYL
jgi:hypothetical protein